MKNFKKQFLATAATIALTLSNGVIAFASADPFSSVQKGAQDATSKFSALGLVIAVFALVIAGVALMSTQRMREWAKGHIGWVIVGIVIIIIASQIVSYVQGMF
ncbi:TrbC/VirB2 family protein [Streptococcus ferus]|uniref:TrbC/VirB2 family protein n=1 Tax=Streptococcus ferus TaxID=1345 RepID=UPI00359FB07B